MACTSQCAVDYVQQARIHLVEELKNPSVIVQNLYKRRVFTDEEVSKIQTEKDDFDKNREILHKVIKKGEAACYELLRIIDTTRKRTLGRPPSERKSGAPSENKTLDLHHWISCFSFKEDPQTTCDYLQGSKPCHRYQTKLKSNARRISKEFWTANKNVFEGSNKPDLFYTSLVLDTEENVSPSKIKKLKSKKSKMSRPKKLRTYIPEKTAGISPSELLKTDKNIVLVGKAGIGKTAVTQEILKLWAERDDKVLDYMFYFDMRETSDFLKAVSLEELLFNLFSEPDENKEEVLNDIKKNSDNVTIIFDGITDLSSSVVKRLVKKVLLPEAKIIVTCRPNDEDEELFSEDSLRVEVKGFSAQSIKTYLTSTLGEEHKKVLDNLELFSLCHVPMYALMVAVCCSSEDSPQPCTVTEIYINIVRFCLQKNSNKPIKNRDLDPHIRNTGNEILFLAEAAFHATEGRTVNLTDLPCTESCVLSFLRQLVIRVCPTQTKNTYAFLHYTMQEFFAALWLFKQPGKIREVLQQCLTKEKKHMKYLIPFMCRLLNKKNPSLMECLIPAEELKNLSDWFLKEMITTFHQSLCERDESDAEGSGSDVDILFICQCLYESQCPEACVYLLDKLDYCLDLTGHSLDPDSCCAVAYVVSQSKERKIQLDLEDAIISEQGLRRLFGCRQSVQWCDLQLWKLILLSEGQMDHVTLLGLAGNQLHLPVEGKMQLFQRAANVLQKAETKVDVCFYWEKPDPVCQRLCLFLSQTLSYISTVSFVPQSSGPSGETTVYGNLFCAAAEREHQTGEKILEMLTSVCGYGTFPLINRDMGNSMRKYQCDFLLDLFSHVKDYETKTGLRILPVLQSALLSVPSVWTINLSERKTSILLEVLKLQSENKPVQLTGWSDEESEVRSFLKCLPYISQLSCDPQFFQSVCSSISVQSRQEAKQLASLLQLLGFTLHLTGELQTKTCRTVGTVLRLCSSKVDLTLTPSKVSIRGLSLLFRSTTQLHSLRLSNHFALRLYRRRLVCPLSLEELSLVSEKVQPSERKLLQVVSGVGCLLRHWDVRRLDLTEFCVPARCLVTLLLHHGPLTVKLSAENSQQLPAFLHEIQDQDLTLSTLTKIGGDLSSCCLDGDLLHNVLQRSSTQTFTVDLRKYDFLQENFTHLLPFLDRIIFKRSTPGFVLTAIREIFKTHSRQSLHSLLRSLNHVISLTCTELDSVDCAALLFLLKHSDRVKLNLLWTSIPAEQIEAVLLTLDKVSHLSVDRNLLLRFIHCCAACDLQQEAASGLLGATQNRLDLSCSLSVELSEQEEPETLCLTAEDCRAVSSILRLSSQDTQLDLRDCEVDDSGLDLLFPVLNKVRLRASKAVILRLVSLVPGRCETDTVRRAVSLSRALGGELDLSHMALDLWVCVALAMMLDLSEGLKELDLSHCQLTDQLLLTLTKQLHKVQVLDLSHNNITDASTDQLLQLVSINPSMDSVRLFSNNIMNRAVFQRHRQFEVW